jgi:AraC-like DNA-binding protein
MATVHARIRPRRGPDSQWDEPSYGLAGDRFTMRDRWGNHTHPDLELNLLLAGDVSYLHGGRRHTIAAGRLTALWAGLPHGVAAVSEMADFCWLTVPLNLLLTWGVDPAALGRLMAGDLVCDHRDPELDLRQVPGWIDDLRAGGEVRTLAALEIQARVRRLLGGGGADHGAAAGSIHVLIDWLGANFRQPVSVADAAAAADMHPRQAMASFRRATGTTIHAWLTRLRLAYAARLLATTRHEVMTIAIDAGFGSRSRFYAAFSATHGCSPEAWRRRMGH